VFIYSEIHLQVTADVSSSLILSTLIMVGICSSKTSVLTRATWCHIPQNDILQYILWYCSAYSLLVSHSARCISSLRASVVSYCYVPSSPILVTLMMEALSSSETSVLARATWRNSPEDTILDQEGVCITYFKGLSYHLQGKSEKLRMSRSEAN
jgi:hypothetical protein